MCVLCLRQVDGEIIAMCQLICTVDTTKCRDGENKLESTLTNDLTKSA